MFTFFVTPIYQLLVSPSHRSSAAPLNSLNVCAAALLRCFPNLARSIRRFFRPEQVENDFRDVGRRGVALIPCPQPSRLPIVGQVQCGFLLRYFEGEKLKNFCYSNVVAVSFSLHITIYGVMLYPSRILEKKNFKHYEYNIQDYVRQDLML